MERDQAKELLRKYREGTLTEQEKAILESWYLNVARSQDQSSDFAALEENLNSVWQSLPLHQSAVKKLPVSRPLTKWISIAASVLMVCSVGVFWLYKSRQSKPVARVAPPTTDVAPGDNRALLTLSDGSKIVLNDTKTGERIQRGHASILKTREGQIVFDLQGLPKTSEKETRQGYNTLSTPKAGHYQVKLPDGTQVWLNAVSTLRFPAVFNRKERLVEVTGEAYFEVAKMTDGKNRIPFKVIAGQQTIEVLGTQFNINSYRDENAIKTTLVEGRIQINLSGQPTKGVILQPGQQAQLAKGSLEQPSESAELRVQQVDVEGVVSWKNGYFRFDQTTLPELMRQIARWYDVEVRFEGPIKEYEFVGQIERSANLSKVLKILELGGVHFRTEGKTIIVTE
ncbi:FecR family protein [Larkinella arboricola]